MIIRFFSYLYLINAVSTIIHEIGHYLSAKLCFGEVLQVVLGMENMSVTIGKLKISPIIFGGRVEVDTELVMKEPKIKIAIFLMSGIIANVLLILMSLCFMKGIVALLTCVINIGIVIFNSVPFFDTDVAMVVNIIFKGER